VKVNSSYERLKNMQDAIRALRNMADSFHFELKRIDTELLKLVGTAAAEELAREAAEDTPVPVAEPLLPPGEPVKVGENGQQEIWDFGEGYHDDCI